MSKIGLHINDLVDNVENYVVDCKPRIVKTLVYNYDALHRIKSETGCFLLGRVYTANQPLDNPKKNALDFFNLLVQTTGNCLHLLDAYEGYNEIANTPDSAPYYNEFTVELANLFHQTGLKLSAYSYSEEQPPYTLWPLLFDGLRASDYLSLHEYSAPDLFDNVGTRFLRYRNVYKILPDDCKKPLILSEFGIDFGCLGGHGGYQAENLPRPYTTQLIQADQELQKDPYVLGATIYCCGVIDPQWATFNVVNNQDIKNYIVNNQEYNYSERYFMKPQFVLGFLEFHKALLKINVQTGNPIEQEKPFSDDVDTITRQKTENGVLFWDKSMNDMIYWSKSRKIYAYNGGNILVTN